MLDFKNGDVFKLRKTGKFTNEKFIAPLFVPGEVFIGEYQTVRDYVVFTNKRVIAVNVQGVTGKKKDYTTLPYSKIQHSLLKHPVYWTWTVSLSCISADLDLLDLSLRAEAILPASPEPSGNAFFNPAENTIHPISIVCRTGNSKMTRQRCQVIFSVLKASLRDMS